MTALPGPILEPSQPSSRYVGVGMVVCAVLYVSMFVARGWLPWDEGQLGQSAEHVLLGGLPHVAYQEPYTGGLSWIYALLFRLYGVDLINIRWLLLAGASVSIVLLYSVARRFLGPIAAGLAVWVSVGLSFPNYFAGLPSWWLLVCATTAVWAGARHVETGDLRFVALAGVAVGTSLTLKQTGMFLIIGFLGFLAYDGIGVTESATSRCGPQRIAFGALRLLMAAGPLAITGILLARRLQATDYVYLFGPILACAFTIVVPRRGQCLSTEPIPFKAIAVALAAAAIPLLLLATPYIVTHQIWQLVDGAFLLPRRRLQAATVTPPVAMILAGVPTFMILFPPRTLVGSDSPVAKGAAWVFAGTLPLVGLWVPPIHEFLWQSCRALGSLLPWVICRGLWTESVHEGSRRRLLFLLVSEFSWTALNQFPFSGSVYFSYVAPLIVIAGAGFGATAGYFRRDAVLPCTMAFLLFAVLGINREYANTLGSGHIAARFDTDLALPRARLRVTRSDAIQYTRLISLVSQHLQGGELRAGPDCPEVYFLAGLRDRYGIIYDFFDDASESTRTARWLEANVVVVNHTPAFSEPLADSVLSAVRKHFPHEEMVGPFEVRWR